MHASTIHPTPPTEKTMKAVLQHAYGETDVLELGEIAKPANERPHRYVQDGHARGKVVIAV